MTTVAQTLAKAFAEAGVQRIFGVPGGGSSLDVIAAAAELGIDFVLTRTESAAVMMAAASAELTHTIGVALTTKGPGTANAANGIAYACLDRAPVIVFTDGFDADEQNYVTHQVFDQRALAGPITKGHSRLESDDVADEIRRLIALSRTAPLGPVLIELTGARAKANTDSSSAGVRKPTSTGAMDLETVAAAGELLRKAEKPVMVVGLEAREEATAKAVQTLAESLGCPVLTTYKAKGVLSDRHEQNVGLFTSGQAEAETVGQADLIVLIGLDPVELLRQPWRYDAPVLDIASVRHDVHYVVPTVSAYGNIAGHVNELAATSQTKHLAANRHRRPSPRHVRSPRLPRLRGHQSGNGSGRSRRGERVANN